MYELLKWDISSISHLLVQVYETTESLVQVYEEQECQYIALFTKLILSNLLNTIYIIYQLKQTQFEIYCFSKQSKIISNYFFSTNFFSNEIPIVENENFIYTCPRTDIFLKNGQTQNIFTFSLLQVYCICNFTPMNFF